ncbi:hypothetical protein D3C86_1627950 [compost metagenome]
MLQAPGQVIEDQFASGVDRLQAFFLQPAIEQSQVTAIGIAGVVGKAFLQPEGVEELVYQGMINGGHKGSGKTGNTVNEDKSQATKKQPAGCFFCIGSWT